MEEEVVKTIKTQKIFVDFRQNILILFIVWYFFETPRKILKAWGNLLLFNLKYFSTFTLLKTLFFPWKRYQFSYGRGFDPKRFFESLCFNFMSRIIGMIIRSILIVIGFLAESLLFLGGIIIFLGWLALIFLLFGGVWLGIIFLS